MGNVFIEEFFFFFFFFFFYVPLSLFGFFLSSSLGKISSRSAHIRAYKHTQNKIKRTEDGLNRKFLKKVGKEVKPQIPKEISTFNTGISVKH